MKAHKPYIEKPVIIVFTNNLLFEFLLNRPNIL